MEEDVFKTPFVYAMPLMAVMMWLMWLFFKKINGKTPNRLQRRQQEKLRFAIFAFAGITIFAFPWYWIGPEGLFGTEYVFGGIMLAGFILGWQMDRILCPGHAEHEEELDRQEIEQEKAERELRKEQKRAAKEKK